jgi:hypothetical protein
MQLAQHTRWPALTIEEQADLIFQHRKSPEYIRTINNTGYHELSEQMHDQMLNPTIEDIRYFCAELPRRAYSATRKILVRDIIQRAMCDGAPPRAVLDYMQSVGDTLDAKTPADMIEELIALNKYGHEGAIVYVILHGFQPVVIPADDRPATDEERAVLATCHLGEAPPDMIINLRYYLDFIARYKEIPADLLARWIDYAMWADMDMLKRDLLQYPECDKNLMFYCIDHSVVMNEIIAHLQAGTPCDPK